MAFGVNFQKSYGTFGEFSINGKNGAVSTYYIQTKLRVANQGRPEDILTKYMKPWREVFDIEKMSFDELVQRDLDDARVANELIPYLIGLIEKSKYPVFPPILAVLVPKAEKKPGIANYYPSPKIEDDKYLFQDYFKFQPFTVDGEKSPIYELQYNPAKCTFVIVDGQHRAMALLALYRELNNDWSTNPYQTYYNHIDTDELEIENFNLPVCILFFPQMFKESEEVQRLDMNLTDVCRQIFLDVNKNARPVSKARELLLDDSQFDSFLMRKALSKLKEKRDGKYLSRIYAIDYGRDEGTESERIVARSPTEYSSSIAIHTMAGALSFGMPDSTSILNTADITYKNKRMNSQRPKMLLKDVEQYYDVSDDIINNYNNLTVLSYNLPNRISKDITEFIVDALSKLWEPILPKMFDKLRPYQVHNHALELLKERLDDIEAQKNTILNKAKSLIFEGSGTRNVFQRHLDRLKNYYEDEGVKHPLLSEEKLENRLEFLEGVESAYQDQIQEFKIERAFLYWSIDQSSFEEPEDISYVVNEANEIFDVFSTQALQIGYVMMIATIVNYMENDDENAPYNKKLKWIKFVSDIVANTLNYYLSPSEDIIRRSLNTGFINETRANVFHRKKPGLRGFINLIRGNELNERAWRNFRYILFEILFCDYVRETHKNQIWERNYESLEDDEIREIRERYKAALDKTIIEIEILKEEYIEKAVSRSERNTSFQQNVTVEVERARGEGKNEDEIEQIRERLYNENREEIIKNINNNLEASLGKSNRDDKNQILRTLGFEINI